MSDLSIKTKRIAKEDQTDNIDHAKLGAKFQESKNYPEAIKEYQKALEKNPNDLSINGNLAALYYSITKYEDALAYYSKLTILNPGEATTYFNLALTNQALGRISEAKENYLKSCKMGFKSGCDVFLNLK